MPQWGIWTILLIAAGTFILLNLLRSREELRRQRPLSRGGSSRDAEGSEARKQPPLTDLDRFLQEVHRRRNADETESAPKPAVRQPASGRTGNRSSAPQPAVPVGRRSPRAGERTPSRRPSASRAQEEVIPLAIAVEEPAGRGKVRSVPEPAAAAFPSSPPPPPAVLLSAKPAVVSVSGKQQDRTFLAFLSSRQSLRDAVILREIFDPPLCKRRPLSD
jgi:hypothetical protein